MTVREGGSSPPDRDAALVIEWLRRWAAEVRGRREWLTELDAAIGDGDHGINLDRGLTRVVAELDEASAVAPHDASAILERAGRTVLGSVGGASGALYGRALMRAGQRLGASAPGSGRLTAAFGEAVEAIVALGHAAAGEKTMLDALLPALAVLREPSPGLAREERVRAAADAAEAGLQATEGLLARKGRASYLGERSVGHLDPGAASSALLVRCLADVLSAATDRR